MPLKLLTFLLLQFQLKSSFLKSQWMFWCQNWNHKVQMQNKSQKFGTNFFACCVTTDPLDGVGSTYLCGVNPRSNSLRAANTVLVAPQQANYPSINNFCGLCCYWWFWGGKINGNKYSITFEVVYYKNWKLLLLRLV